ncbi:MAG TPA: ABC transporter substrate-binding protein [Vicinamibacteria bacterium]|nr:ABC transporter substrate-binding protein [Vicinamibacteria bacterium]
MDGRADIYALGTVLYECLVGQPPFSGESQAVLYRIVHEFPQSPRELGAAVDAELDMVVMSCLEKEPARRPQHAAEIAEALKRYRSHLRDSDRERSVTGMTRSFLGMRPALQPFVGRAKESAELQQRLNAAIAGDCQFVVVSGEPGIGKTRLLEELANLAKARQIRVLHGRSVEQDRAFPFQGFCEVIQEHFRDAGASPPLDFSDLAADLLALFPMLNEISEIRTAATGESKLARGGTAAPESRTQVFELLARTLTRIAGGKPLVLILEDLHGADVTIEALPYIATRLGPTPTLILGTYRTTEVDERHPLTRVLDSFRGDRRFAALTLGPFSPSEHRGLMETLVGGSELSEVLVERLFDAAKGNPFFTKELVRSLLDAGGISKDDTGKWSLSGEAEIASAALPATIQQAVEKRLRRLPEDLREILSLGAVLGKTFDSRDLEALTKGTDVDDAIDRLVQQGLIEEERESRGEQLAFSSGVVRDVLYGSLSPRKRRSLHRRCAEVLEARHGGRLDRVLPQLVHHFHQGDVPEKAVEYGLRLARTSLDAFSAEEAVRSAKTALDFLDEEWQGDRGLEAEARLLLARAHRMAGDADGALEEAAAAARIFESARPQGSPAALLLAAEVAWQARRTEEAGAWVDRGLLAARGTGDPDTLRRLLSLATTIATLLGDYARVAEYQEEGARLAPEGKDAPAPEAVPAGGRLLVALANPVRSTDPTGIDVTEEFEVAANVYETLLQTDSGGGLVPGLCERWESLEGGRSFALTLRRDVRFSDGVPLTATDVKASIEACVKRATGDLPPAFAVIRGSGACRRGDTAGIEGIAAQGAHTLSIHLLEPLPMYPAMLTAGTTGIVRPAGESGRDGSEFLGTGPFRVASHAPERVVLERNARYWNGAPPLLEAIEFRAGLSATAIARGFRAGEIDLARDLAPQDLDEVLRDPRFRNSMVETPTKTTYFATFNTRNGAVAESPGLRRALARSVRASELVWRTLGRFAEPALCLIPPGMLGHDPGRRSHPLTPAEATELLRSAGVTGSLKLRAAVHPLLLDRYAALLDALLATWAELRIQVEVGTATMDEYLACYTESRGFDLRLGRWNADYEDPDNFTHTLFHSEAGGLRNWFSSEAADQLLQDARAEVRPAVRESLYRRFEHLLFEADALVPLFYDVDYRLVGPRVRGLALTGTAPFVNYVGLGKVEGAAALPEPRRPSGGTLLVPIAGVVSQIDPALAETFEQAEVVPTVFESLTRVEPGGARIVPWLAAEFRTEEAGRVYRFRLRDDVRFHDGRRLTARDVRHSFERLLKCRESTSRAMFAPIVGAKALLEGTATDLEGLRIHSATEFTIELREPIVFFPVLVSHPAAAIVPEGTGDGTSGWVGTGPFRVAAFEPARRLELERNRRYWREGYPRSEAIVFSFGVPPEEMLQGLRSGRFSIVSDLLPSDADALRRDPEYASRYVETPQLATYYAAFNVHRGPLADKAQRRRLVEAVDVPRLVRQTLGRGAIPASGFIPPGLLGHDPGTPARHTSSPGGRSAPASIELTAAVHPLFFTGYSALARELTGAFAEAGVKLRTVNRTMDEWREAAMIAGVDVVLGRWGVDYLDADSIVYVLHSEGWLGQLVGTPELSRLIERGRTEAVPGVRHAIYREVEELLSRESLLLPLFHEQAYRFARPEIEGLRLSLGGDAAYEEVRIRA